MPDFKPGDTVWIKVTEHYSGVDITLYIVVEVASVADGKMIVIYM